VTFAALAGLASSSRRTGADVPTKIAAQPVAVAASAPSTEALPASVAVMPLVFAENRGQFPPEARFSTRYRGINAFVTNEGFRFGLIDPEALRFDPKSAAPTTAPSGKKLANVFFTFEGASPDVVVRGEKPLPVKLNYFLGAHEESWKTDVPAFAAVRHEEMYRGIDVVFGDRRGLLEYDVVVKNGGDLGAVVVRVDGAESLTLNEDGSLLTETAAGPFLQTPPVAWVKDEAGVVRDVACRFELVDDRRFRFVCDGYDGAGELTVDPGLVYAYIVSGSLADQGTAVGGDALTAVYVGGRTASNNFPATPGAFDVTLTTGNFDAFVAKLDPNTNALAYCTYLGGSGMDYVGAMRVDGAGFVYATGQAGSSGFPTTTGAYDTTYNGQGDGYVTKINPTGNALVFSTFIGGTAEERVHAMTLDAAGAVYIAGQTLSHLNYPGASTQTIPVGTNYNVGAVNWNVAVTKVNPAGNTLGYSFRTGGEGSDWAYGLEVDAAGQLHVVGATASTSFPTASAFNSVKDVGFDAFCFKVTNNASAFVFSTFLGGQGSDQAFSVDVDQFGSVYVGGGAGLGFPTTFGAFDTTGDGADGFVTKLEPTGQNLIWSTYLGGSSTDQVNAVRVDQGLRPIVGGWTNSANFPTTPSGFDTSFAGGGAPAEGFLVKLTWQADALLYGSFIGGTNNDEVDGIDLDANGWAYVSGITLSSAATFLPATVFTGGPGVEEAFTAKFELPASPSVTIVGQGCSFTPIGNLPNPPTMNASMPTIGEILTIYGSHATPFVSGAAIMSVAPSYGLPISADCTIYLDLTTVIPLLAYTPSGTGDWAAAMFLANDPSWVGAVLRMQGITFTPASPWGFEMTNGIDLEIGY
jgi:hypothetical protein